MTDSRLADTMPWADASRNRQRPCSGCVSSRRSIAQVPLGKRAGRRATRRPRTPRDVAGGADARRDDNGRRPGDGLRVRGLGRLGYPGPAVPEASRRDAMEFGLFFLMQRDEAWSEQAVYDSALEQMVAAEPHGYASVWIAEHHFNDYGLCPTPPVLASFVAARTRSLRLGMGVSLLPLHHPVDLAEQLAVLDVVSGGRLDVGIGRGGTLQDYQTFQSDRGDSRARVEEGIALMRECWSGQPFSFAGRFHTAERLHVRPCPPQRPHPPLFVASNSEDSVRSAARLGLPTLSSYFVPADEL